MGLGDEIMVTALAKKNRRKFQLPSTVWGKDGNPRMHPVWENNPNILTPQQYQEMYDAPGDIMHCSVIRNHPGRRHYIDWTRSTPDRWIFQPWDIEPGEIYFDKEEEFFRNAARPDKFDVLLDPGVKAGRENKMWPSRYWDALATGIDRQITPHWHINNPDKSDNIRYWLADLTRYKLIICHEGGLHHAAAALGIPCIVLFGGFISPDITGYTLPNTQNLTHAKEFCGMIRPCQHCRDEMEKIKPEEVMEHVKDLLHVS